MTHYRPPHGSFGDAAKPPAAMPSFFFSSRRLHTRLQGDWSSDVCSSDLGACSGTTSWPGRRTSSRLSTRCPCEPTVAEDLVRTLTELAADHGRRPVLVALDFAGT